MTKVLNLSLLGPLHLSFDDLPLTELASAKAQAVLCYLVMNGRAHSRQALAGLLWGDLPEADARRNLRGVVMKLRERLEPYLLIQHQTITFNREMPYWLDVEQFRTGVQASSGDLTHLQQCAHLYRGEFLEELYVRQAPEFETWLQQQRAELHQQAVLLFTALAKSLGEQRQFEEGIQAARRLVALDVTRETSQQLLMRLLAESGQRAAALTQFEQFRQQLQAELGVGVAESTAVLAEQIRNGELQVASSKWQVAGGTSPIHLVTPSPPHPTVSSPPTSSPFIAGPPITHPARFFGRERELRRLFNLLRQRPLQNAAIIGPRRSGKTSLLHYLKSITTTPPEQLRPSQEHAWLPDPLPYRWAFVDFQDARLSSVPGLTHHLLTAMKLPVPDDCSLETFLDIVSDQLQNPTVILFDEIGVAMERYSELDDSFWESLRSLATNQVDGNLAFILSSHESPDVLAQHRGMGSPFFNIFGYTAVLGPLSDSAARELIASSPLPIPTDDAEWMLETSGRWPMPLQILCRERLLALEAGETGDEWREDGRRQAAPFMM